MTEILDVHGLYCPLPAMKVIDKLKQRPDETLVVLTDDPAACGSIIRSAKSLGYQCSYQKDGQEVKIIITPLHDDSKV
jgi:TusA-related sulfurtransferase